MSAAVQKLDELYSGKAKSVYRCDDPNLLILEFRNDTSAFDGKKLAQLANKGAVNNQFNAHVMQHLAKAGLKNHFVKQLSAEESLVKKLDMLPVEAVVRNRAAGSLCRRLGIEQGQVLNPPVFEFFLKNDALGDPMINQSHMQTFGWAAPDQVARMQTLALEANQVLSQLFEKAGIVLVDYKLEFGLFEGELLLGDEFTPDGCRLWDKASGEKLDKDRFRQDLGNVVESYIEVAERLGVKLELVG